MKKLLFKTTGAVILTAAILSGTTSYWTEKAIITSFNQETASEINYQVFYTLDGEEKFNEPHSVKYQAQATESSIKIQIPETHIARFRLDLGIKPEKVTIGNLSIQGTEVIELNDFNEFRYSPDVEEKVIENNKIMIISNKNDPYMIYNDSIDISEENFIDWTKATLIGALSFFTGFFLLGFLFKKRKTKK